MGRQAGAAMRGGVRRESVDSRGWGLQLTLQGSAHGSVAECTVYNSSYGNTLPSCSPSASFPGPESKHLESECSR